MELGVVGGGMVPSVVHILTPGMGSLCYLTQWWGEGVKVTVVILLASQLTLKWGDSHPCLLGLAGPHIGGARVAL